MKKKNRIALIHDILIEYGGAERTLEVFVKKFPNCDIYTFYIDKTNKNIMRAIGSSSVYSSPWQRIGFIKNMGKLVSIFKPLAWLYFYRLKIPQYDTVVSFSSSYNSKVYKKQKHQNHISYIFTPPKYLYDEVNDIVLIKKFPFSILFYPLMSFFRYLDKKSISRVDKVIAISKTVQNRIKKYYGIKSQLIYPPVTIKQAKTQGGKRGYYLFLSRLVKQKGVDLVLSSALKYDFPLTFAGKGYMSNKIKLATNKKIRYVGFVPEKKLFSLYSNAKALIYCAKDEDFGLVPIEAMSCGTPVIGYFSGGLKETLIDGQTGIFFRKYNPESLNSAIKKFEILTFNHSKIKKHALNFSDKKFLNKFVKAIYNL